MPKIVSHIGVQTEVTLPQRVEAYRHCCPQTMTVIDANATAEDDAMLAEFDVESQANSDMMPEVEKRTSTCGVRLQISLCRCRASSRRSRASSSTR